MSKVAQVRVSRFAVVFLLLAALALVYGKGALPSSTPSSKPAQTGASPNNIKPNGDLSLITEPAAGVVPVLNLISGAKISVDLVMYELEDLQVEQALASAQSHGIRVRVLLNGGYYGRAANKPNPNQSAYDYLRAHHVPVRWTPGHFALTHQKSLVIDGRTALVMTFNLTPQYYPTSRDFGVTDTATDDVTAIESTFSADWQGSRVSASGGDDLLWSPGAEPAILALINGARSSLKIYNEEMADSKVVAALGAAALRGVDVRVVMTNQPSWHHNFARLAADGVRIRTYANVSHAPLYIHAKMIIADNDRAFVGSENFSVTSLADNRELGLVTTNQSLLVGLSTTFRSDYVSATSY